MDETEKRDQFIAMESRILRLMEEYDLKMDEIKLEIDRLKGEFAQGMTDIHTEMDRLRGN